MHATSFARRTGSIAALGGVAALTALGFGVAWIRHRYFCGLCQAVRRLKLDAVRERAV
jgi:hypothetical protein